MSWIDDIKGHPISVDGDPLPDRRRIDFGAGDNVIVEAIDDADRGVTRIVFSIKADPLPIGTVLHLDLDGDQVSSFFPGGIGVGEYEGWALIGSEASDYDAEGRFPYLVKDPSDAVEFGGVVSQNHRHSIQHDHPPFDSEALTAIGVGTGAGANQNSQLAHTHQINIPSLDGLSGFADVNMIPRHAKLTTVVRIA